MCMMVWAESKSQWLVCMCMTLPLCMSSTMTSDKVDFYVFFNSIDSHVHISTPSLLVCAVISQTQKQDWAFNDSMYLCGDSVTHSAAFPSDFPRFLRLCADGFRCSNIFRCRGMTFNFIATSNLSAGRYLACLKKMKKPTESLKSIKALPVWLVLILIKWCCDVTIMSATVRENGNCKRAYSFWQQSRWVREYHFDRIKKKKNLSFKVRKPKVSIHLNRIQYSSMSSFSKNGSVFVCMERNVSAIWLVLSHNAPLSVYFYSHDTWLRRGPWRFCWFTWQKCLRKQ